MSQKVSVLIYYIALSTKYRRVVIDEHMDKLIEKTYVEDK